MQYAYGSYGWKQTLVSLRRIMRLLGLIFTASLALAGCATPPSKPWSQTPKIEKAVRSKMIAPTPAEARQYVQAHWFGFGLLFSRFFKGHVDEDVTLVALANEKCARSDIDSFLCRVDLTGRFASGEQATRRMQMEFTRDGNGALEEIITISGD